MRHPRLLLVILTCVSIALICAPATAQSNLALSQPNAAASQNIAGENPPPLGWLGPMPQDVFRKIVSYGSGGALADSLAVGDLNGDGIPDLVVANACQGASKYLSCTNAATQVSVLLGTGGGNFRPAVSYGAGGYSYPDGNGWSSVAIADVNGDHHPDLIVATQCRTEACTNSGVSVLLGNGDGTFQPAVSYNSGGVGFDGYFTSVGGQWIAVGDLRGNGKQDLILALPCQDASCANGAISVLHGNGDGTFQPAVAYNIGASSNSIAVAVADVNQDGKQDVVAVDGSMSVLLGNGDGTLQSPVSYSTGYPDSTGIAIGDLNGDGKLDVVTGSESFVWCFVDCGPEEATVSVLLGNGDGTFQPAVTFGTGGFFATSVALADMDGDGKADLVVTQQCTWRIGACNQGGGQVAVLRNNGDGSFLPPLFYSTGGLNAEAVALADLDGDGRPDLLMANHCTLRGKGGCVSGGSVSVMLNNFTSQTTTVVVASPNPSTVNQTVTFSASISANATVPDGEVVTFFNRKSVLGTGTTVNGVASLNTAFPKAGTYSIKASYAGDVFHKSSSATVQEVVNKAGEAEPISGDETATPANAAGALKPQPLDAGKRCGTSTYLSTSGSPSLITDDVTFTAQAIANDTCRRGEQITCDDGRVSFYDNGALMGSGAVQNCQAVFDTGSLTAGKHHIVAIFAPGMGWHQSSSRLIQVVNKWPTTISLASTPNPSSHKQDVTFTAAVVSSFGGFTGNVKFMNGTRKIGIVAVDDNGMATLTTANLPVGTDAITAEYLGDTYNAVGTSDVLNQVVQP
jgi:hypothetical protein